MKFASIAVLVLLVGQPFASPLLAEIPCCPAHEESVMDSDSCCSVSAVPEDAAPVRLSVPNELPAPSPAGFSVPAEESTPVAAPLHLATGLFAPSPPLQLRI